jgi:hypothetical protein
MVRIETLMREGKVSRIGELEIGRYANFFENSHKDNLEHCKFTLGTFPRWSIISGYYAMHDITKLLLAKKFRLKMEIEVHATTIKVVREVLRKPKISEMLEKGYSEFIRLANDLAEARKERVKVQYYTGTEFMKGEYRRRAGDFLKNMVEPYLEAIRKLEGELK